MLVWGFTAFVIDRLLALRLVVAVGRAHRRRAAARPAADRHPQPLCKLTRAPCPEARDELEVGFADLMEDTVKPCPVTCSIWCCSWSAAAFAVAGYRQGFIIGVLSFLGFTGGAVAGIYLVLGLVMALTSRQNVQAVLAIIGVFAAAVAGMLVASAFGVLIRSHVRGRLLTLIDSIGGAAVNVIAILVLAWLIGNLVAYAPPVPSYLQAGQQFSAAPRRRPADPAERQARVHGVAQAAEHPALRAGIRCRSWRRDRAGRAELISVAHWSAQGPGQAW